MKYFTKYLSIDGKIQKDDFLLQNDVGITQCLSDTEGERLTKTGYKKVKLFLCSRDINYKDKFFFKDNPTEMINKGGLDSDDRYWVSDGETLYSKGECFKVIGEISPEAIWVKEGDEFEQNQIKINYPPTLLSSNNTMITIKCSQRNSFH